MKKSLFLILFIVSLLLLLLSVIALPIYLFWGTTPEKLAGVAAGEM